MDPTYPSVRIGMMLEDSHADVVLTHSRLADSVQRRRAMSSPSTRSAPATPAASKCPT